MKKSKYGLIFLVALIAVGIGLISPALGQEKVVRRL